MMMVTITTRPMPEEWLIHYRDKTAITKPINIITFITLHYITYHSCIKKIICAKFLILTIILSYLSAKLKGAFTIKLKTISKNFSI
jgi:hypothetical protein